LGLFGIGGAILFWQGAAMVLVGLIFCAIASKAPRDD